MLTAFPGKFYVQLFLLFFSISTTAAQPILPDHSFGQGIVSIGWYSFPPNDTTGRDPVSILHIPNVYTSTYFIKQNKVLRRDQIDSVPGADSSVRTITDDKGRQFSVRMHVGLEHPSYLIDWTARAVYRAQEAPIDLQKELSEIFYRAMDNNKAVVLSLQKDSPIFIANVKCFKGLAKDKEDVFTFFYSEIPCNVRSPLNGFLPSDFPYNVMRVDLTTEWSVAGVRRSKADMIFQVLAIKECPLDDKLFETQTP